ncbi:hypothetical protein CV102_17750 [Natronococcus pandeyae]|uniref:Uncharacterized protein n=1 Tax=Natronococcus pandeyae TaxID=2055836 RepID=A0A8J8Q0H1_9EURY|nr:hypothetical protein [Natronococcus pandeyae]TYL37171.1 hypothetical protein CV102_17750 [Natronococcus pandeyae]
MEDGNQLTNIVTIIGKGVPANYEISVDGNIEMVDADPLEKTTIVSEHAVEGAIETGVQRFRFSGQMANVHLVDWNGVAAPKSSSTPEVHIDYGVSGRKNSR